jgi:hypothetical protein
MAQKKKKTAKKKNARNKSVAKKTSAAKKRAATKKKSATAKKKSVARKKPARRKKTVARGRQEITFPVAGIGRRGLDSASAGQSGDTQGLSRREDEDSESVAELTEEGQYFEAEAVSGVENAKDPDEGEVTTSEVPEDDVPPEYTDRETDT